MRRKPALILATAGTVLAALIVGAVLVLGVRRYLEPLPAVRFEQAELSTQVGGAPPVSWPSRGSAAVMIEGIGTVGVHADEKPRPLASVVKFMTALVILDSHPLTTGEKGPTFQMTSADVAAYRAAIADDQSAVLVLDGETLTQY